MGLEEALDKTPLSDDSANARTELGAKLILSAVSGYTFLEHISFDNFNERIMLEEAIKEYKRKFGMLPSQILAGTIYRSRSNRTPRKELNIKLSRLPLSFSVIKFYFSIIYTFEKRKVGQLFKK